MNIIEHMLTDPEVVDVYGKIDKVNKYPANHGMKHIWGAYKISQEFGKLFGFNKREQEILDVCVILHDIGQTEGRENHGLKSAKFAEQYLPKFNYFSNEELAQIYSAIETHDEFKDYSKLQNKFSWFVNLVDKLDFSKTRLEDGYEAKFGYINSSDIERLEFYLENKEFKIIIKTIENPKIIAPENLYSRNLICKAMILFDAFCKHFGLKASLFLEDLELNLSKFQKDAMVDR